MAFYSAISEFKAKCRGLLEQVRKTRWIWMFREPARLSHRVARILDDARNQLWLSPISVWELVMLTQKGRVQLSEDTVVRARSAIEKLRLQKANLTIEVAWEASVLALPLSDPADRLLRASARVFDPTLVTAD